MAIADKVLIDRARRGVEAAWTIAVDVAQRCWRYAQQNTPVFGRAASRRRKSVVLAPYQKTYSLSATLSKIVGLPVLALGCLIYGFFFGLTAPTLIVAFAVPIGILAAMSIWALPDQRKAPTFLIELLYPAIFIALVLWPNYVALSLPGLPWITMLRLIGLPLVVALLVNLSVSAEFRRRASEAVTSVKLVWVFVCLFIFTQIITLAISKSPGASAQLVFNQQIYWTAIFVIGSIIFLKMEYIEKYMAFICLLSIPIAVLSFIEVQDRHVLWMNQIPKILLPPDPSLRNILTPLYRTGTNIYRVRTSFSTPLEEAEYLSLLTPFLLYFGFYAKKPIFRVASLLWIPIIFVVIRLTDCRLGVVGMLVSLLLYGVLWSIVRWRAHPKDLFAAATVYMYPLVFVLGVGLVFASHRLHAMVFGANAEASSNAARANQLTMAIAAFSKAPWGHGTGQSGGAMGYGAGEFIAIDNYFISILLDYGALGVIAWYGMFITALVLATRYSMSQTYAGRIEARLLAPIAVELAAFLIVKWVHGGDYTHPINFMILGMVSALVYSLHHGSPSVPTAIDMKRAPPHPVATFGADFVPTGRLGAVHLAD